MMSKFVVALIASGFLASVSPAFAGDQAQGTLASAAVPSGAIVVGDLPWKCDGSTCAGPVDPSRFGDARACRDLAEKEGEVTAFRGGKGDLAAEELGRCNKYARKR